MYKLKELPKEERPRERLLTYGASTLSNEELLAIILKTGTKSMSVKELANQILVQIGDIKNLKNISYQKISSISGIGESKACSLLAIGEIAKRITREVTSLKNIAIKNTEIAFQYFRDLLGDKKQEYFYCIYLDNKKKVLDTKLLFMGTLNQSIVHPREVFKEAYLLSASAIICAHNHPSGNIEPSLEDIELTKRLSSIGVLMGIKLIDHLIIGSESYYSFLENNLL